MIENNVFNSRVRKCFNTISADLVIYEKGRKELYSKNSFSGGMFNLVICRGYLSCRKP